MATTVSLQTIAEAVIQRLWAGRRPIVDVADSSGNTTSTLVIADQAYSSAHANLYDGVGIWVVGGTGNQASRVIRAGFAPSTGTWTLSPALGAAPNSATVWFLYGLSRDDILEATNRVLDRLYMQAYLPLTMVADGDMEANNTSSWTAVSGATLSKVTTAARVITGQRALRIQTTAVDTGAASANIRVHEDEVLLVSVAVMCDVGSATIELRDVTNGATITASVTVDQEAYTEVRREFTVPVGCEEVSLRILAASSTSDIYVGWASVLPMSRYVVDVPSTVEDAAFIDGLWELPQGFTSEADYSFVALGRAFEPYPVPGDLRDYIGVNSHRLTLPKRVTRPLFMQLKRPYSALTLDSDTTAAPETLVVAGVSADLLNRLANRVRSESVKADMLTRMIEARREYTKLLTAYDVNRPVTKSRVTRRVAL